MFAKSTSTGLAAALCATLLSGCAGFNTDPVSVGSVSDDYRTRHPIVVTQKEQTLDVAISTNTRRLDRATQSNITAFASTFQSRGGGTMVVLEPAGAANSHAVKRVREDVVKAITTAGIDRSQIGFQSYDASGYGSTAPVRLSYVGVAAVTGECGKWIEDLGTNPDNKQYHDFGCATQSNLAAMIENPNDVLGPRAMTPPDAERRGNALSQWREGSAQPGSEVQY